MHILKKMRKTLVFGLVKGMTNQLMNEDLKGDGADFGKMKKIAGKLSLLMATVDAMKDRVLGSSAICAGG